MSSHETNRARVVPLRPAVAPAPDGPAPARAPGEPLWREVVGGVLRRERLAQERTLKDVADAARISVPYLSELERGRKEASSEILAAAAHALGLGLADLLALSHRELVRPVRSTTARSTTARSTTARFGRTVGAARQGDVRLAA
ncbi:helix-turn-helix domain-containing protein [Streptomyces sp. OZ13]|uniref:helix-turn-helix domain-containing protein n=1 Tax=Streptomyces sp. OZ13 TaxID=3452210 RepID=UPI003F89BD63